MRQLDARLSNRKNYWGKERRLKHRYIPHRRKLLFVNSKTVYISCKAFEYFVIKDAILCRDHHALFLSAYRFYNLIPFLVPVDRNKRAKGSSAFYSSNPSNHLNTLTGEGRNFFLNWSWFPQINLCLQVVHRIPLMLVIHEMWWMTWISWHPFWSPAEWNCLNTWIRNTETFLCTHMLLFTTQYQWSS